MRSSTRRTTRSFASWSNFLGIFQIFPSTQTEQNLGHFNALNRRLVWDEIAALSQQGVTVLVITHAVSEVESCLTHLGIMDKGGSLPTARLTKSCETFKINEPLRTARSPIVIKFRTVGADSRCRPSSESYLETMSRRSRRYYYHFTQSRGCFIDLIASKTNEA